MMKQRGHMSTDDVRKLKSISPPSQTTRDDAVLLRLLDFDRQYRAERGKSGAFTYSPQNVVAAFRQQEQSK